MAEKCKIQLLQSSTFHVTCQVFHSMLEKNLLASEIKCWLSNIAQLYSAGGIKADFNPAPK